MPGAGIRRKDGLSLEIVTKVLDNAWFLPYIPEVAVQEVYVIPGGSRPGGREPVRGCNGILVAARVDRISADLARCGGGG